jgi:hypothetical protein
LSSAVSKIETALHPGGSPAAFTASESGRNFRTREETAAEKAVLELRDLQATSVLRPAMSWLTEEQLREAESAFRRLPAEALALTRNLDYALIHYRAQLQEVPLDQAIGEYIGKKKLEFERGILSTFFKYAQRAEWIPTNLIEKTPHHRIRHRRGSATTLSAETSAQLMAYVEQFHGGIFVPYFALYLFAGIRPCIE